MHKEVEKVRIDSIDEFNNLKDFAGKFLPDWSQRIDCYSADRPIFDMYGIEDEIENALHRKSVLKSGGHLVIDQTEAMTTIDVNTGGYTGHRTLEETIYKTNLEAAHAIARQLRLRNLGGIIIIDFIDMNSEEHKRQVMLALERALERDHAKTNICEISSLGLVEMTRKRTTESLGHVLCEPCPVCSGRGVLKSADTVCLEVFREILRSSRQFEATRLLVVASTGVVDRILDDQSTTVAELEEVIGKTIRFQREDQYTQEQFDVVLL
jgi:ribonuclease G